MLQSFIVLTLLAAAFTIRFFAGIVRFMVKLFLDHPVVILREEAEGRSEGEAPQEPHREDVWLRSRDGTLLRGWFIRSPLPTRRLVVFFHEYGASGEAWRRYLGFLPEEGFDVFTFDFSGHGASETPEGHKAYKWPTQREVGDAAAVLEYVRGRAREAGWEVQGFGASRGAAAMFLAAASHPWLSKLACEGMSSTLGTIRSYMRRWVGIYLPDRIIQHLPPVVPRIFAHLVVVDAQIREGVQFPSLEDSLDGLHDRRALFIYGERDTLISPTHRSGILDRFPGAKQLWLAPAAGHLKVGARYPGEYRERLLAWLREAGATSSRRPAGPVLEIEGEGPRAVPGPGAGTSEEGARRGPHRAYALQDTGHEARPAG